MTRTIPSRPFPAALLCTLAGVLAGCAPPPPAPVRGIAQDMTAVLHSMDQMGQVRFPMVRPGSVLPAELRRPMAWRWTGRLDTAVRLIGERVGYTVVTPLTPTSPLISIDEPDSTAAGLLDALAAAAEPEARIDVDLLSHTIRISWHV